MNDIITALKAKAATDPQLRAVLNRVKKGTADFKDTAAYSTRFAHLLGKTLSDNVLEIPTDVRETITTELLRYGYDDLNTVLAEVQTSLDAAAGIHIRPQQAAFPAERVQQYVHSLVDPTVNDNTIQRRARSGSDTITKSFHDDYIQKNATFRNDAGLNCYIVREGSNCCEWCSGVAGKYRFGTQPDDIFRRHDNCDCTIIYDGQVLRGKQNADGSRSKTWEEVPNADSSYNPTVLSPEEAERLQAKNQPQILTNGKKRVTISGRGSGTGNPANTDHTLEIIGEIDFSDKKAVAKSLQEFEQKYKDSRIEHCRVFCPNGEVYEVHGDLDTVETKLLGNKMEGSINEHNHVTGRSQYSFSWDDLQGCIEDGSDTALAFDEKYRYSMIFPKDKLNLDEALQAYIDAEKDVGNINAISYQSGKGKQISDEDNQHEVIRRVCERFGVKYERKRKT